MHAHCAFFTFKYFNFPLKCGTLASDRKPLQQLIKTATTTSKLSNGLYKKNLQFICAF